MADDLNFQKLSTVQSDHSVYPRTLASATTVAPDTFVTFFTGTLALTTVTPPVNGPHMLCFIFTNAAPGIIATTGNIVRSSTLTVQNIPYFFVYDPIGAKYYVHITA